MPREDLEWAIAATSAKKRRTRYKLVRDYYDGEHRLAFATDRFTSVFGERLKEVADNLCPAVVDSIVDRLSVVGFSSSASRRRSKVTDGKERTVVSDPLAARAWAIWKRNRMKQRATEIHRDSLLTGDGYAIVWPAPDGSAAIWPQRAEEMAIEYSEQTPGEIERAARVWRLRDGRMRVNIYYPDSIEKFVTERNRGALVASATGFVAVPGDDVVENAFGRIPVFHFPNKRLFDYGVSELNDVIPLQDALNKSVCDMLVAMEFASYRQRWATGTGEIETDEEGKPKQPPFVPGADTVFALENADARFGDFNETNLEQFLKVQEDLRAEIARVSGTPLHYLFITRGDFPSGEAMKSAEARFTEKLEDRQESHGNTWEDALTFALRVESARLPASFELQANWKDATPRSEEERARTAAIKKSVGVSRREALRDLEYDDETIDQMIAEEPTVAPVDLPPEQP